MFGTTFGTTCLALEYLRKFKLKKEWGLALKLGYYKLGLKIILITKGKGQGWG